MVKFQPKYLKHNQKNIFFWKTSFESVKISKNDTTFKFSFKVIWFGKREKIDSIISNFISKKKV